jgi:hypothetical protein
VAGLLLSLAESVQVTGLAVPVAAAQGLAQEAGIQFLAMEFREAMAGSTK